MLGFTFTPRKICPVGVLPLIQLSQKEAPTISAKLCNGEFASDRVRQKMLPGMGRIHERQLSQYAFIVRWKRTVAWDYTRLKPAEIYWTQRTRRNGVAFEIFADKKIESCQTAQFTPRNPRLILSLQTDGWTSVFFFSESESESGR